MSLRDDLKHVLMNADNGLHGTMAGLYADAILAAGWVPAEVIATRLEALAETRRRADFGTKGAGVAQQMLGVDLYLHAARVARSAVEVPA